MNYHFQINTETQGFWAECCELKGCVTSTCEIQKHPGVPAFASAVHFG